MKFYLDTRNSEATGLAYLSLGDEPGGEIVATLPYKEQKDWVRARFFANLPQAIDELSGIRDLWWYMGNMKFECPVCKTKTEIPGASDAQIGRLERLRFRLME